MGFEYHDRKRNPDGTFAPHKHGMQVHIYCTEAQWRTLRLASANSGEELSTFCREAALEKARPILKALKITVKG